MDKEKILNRWRNPPQTPVDETVKAKEIREAREEIREAREEKKRIATEVKGLVAMSQELNRLADNCETLGIPLSSLAELAQEVAQRMENLRQVTVLVINSTRTAIRVDKPKSKLPPWWLRQLKKRLGVHES